MLPYDVCIFDLDGTLTDPFEGIKNAFCYTLEKLGITEMPENPERFIGPPLHESFRVAYGFSDEEARKAVEIFREYYGKAGFSENEVYPGIAALLKSLKYGDITLAVATSKYKLFADRVLKHFDLYRYFDIVSGDSADGTLSRDGKTKIIRIALNAVNPKRLKNAVMIGDRHHDIIGAREAGIDSIGITWGYGSREELADAGATHIAESTDELGRLLH